MSEYLSQRKFAEHAGVSHVWINRLVKEGKLPTNEKGRIPLTEGLKAFKASQQPGYDANREHGKAQRQAAVKPTRKAAPPPDPELDDNDDEPTLPSIGGSTAGVNAAFNKARLAEKTYQAKLKQIEYQREKGELVDKDDIREDAMKTGAELREKLSAIPPRIAPLCEGLPAREIQGIIDVAINEALEALHKSRFAK